MENSIFNRIFNYVAFNLNKPKSEPIDFHEFSMNFLHCAESDSGIEMGTRGSSIAGPLDAIVSLGQHEEHNDSRKP